MSADESKCAYERDRLTRMEERLNTFTDPDNGVYKRIKELDKRLDVLERFWWIALGVIAVVVFASRFIK